ncbi:Protein FAR1-RELATED SEQUENCE [Abeliophyllum distichum]|uniref:Protein FAR1-RELATED SEQUENCE n=1 Tax=Abeliophyllum distichum TaxID=126358 RepID=A0ABD1RUE0_9LAMI
MSHRSVTATKKALAQQFSDANIPTCQQLRLMEIDAGGLASIGSYKCFGEAVVFDTTYNTNKYSMVFVPFVEVNHHGQTVLFDCGLLSNELTESFVWLLSKFLDAMSGQAPNIIITDQDAAIAKSISMVLPLTFYRWTKNAKVSVCEDSSTGISDDGSSSTSLMSRHRMLAHKSSLLVDDAALTDARTTFLIGEFESLHVRIKEIDDGGNVAVAFNRSRSKNREESHAIHDPCLVRAKGCGKRLKSSKEKSLSKNT